MAFWQKKDASPLPPDGASKHAPAASKSEISASQQPVTPKPAKQESVPVERDIFALPLGKVRTAIGSGTSIEGRLTFDSPVQIDGSVRGEINSSQPLVLGPASRIEGVVAAPEVTVLGFFDGTVVAFERLTIAPGAIVFGSAASPNLVVQEGGILNAFIASTKQALETLKQSQSSRLSANIERLSNNQAGATSVGEADIGGQRPTDMPSAAGMLH